MSSRVTKTWTQENTWRCTSCGDAKQLGRYMKCQVCGSPKEKDEKDIPVKPDASKAVKDPKQLKDAAAGEDWVCEFCTGRVKNLDGKCVTCAAGRDIAEEKPKYEIETNADGTVRSLKSTDGKISVSTGGGGVIRGITVDGAKLIGDDGVFLGGKKPPKPPKPPKDPSFDWRFWKKDSPFVWIFPAMLGVAALVAMGFYLFGTHEIQVQVARTTWDYTSLLHQKTLMHGEGWGSRTSSTYSLQHKADGYGPRGDGFNVVCEGKYYGSEDCNPYQCRPHTTNYDCNCTTYDCNCHTKQSCTSSKNGYSNCTETETCSTCSKCSTCQKTEYDTCYHSCNVYKDYCTYDYYEWPVIATRSTGGTAHKVFWPELEAIGPDQRLDRIEKYEVVFTRESKANPNEPERWTHAPGNLAEFNCFFTGEQWIADVNRVGSIWPKRVATR